MFARFLSGAHEPPAGSIDSGVEGGWDGDARDV